MINLLTGITSSINQRVSRDVLSDRTNQLNNQPIFEVACSPDGSHSWKRTASKFRRYYTTDTPVAVKCKAGIYKEHFLSSKNSRNMTTRFTVSIVYFQDNSLWFPHSSGFRDFAGLQSPLVGIQEWNSSL